MNILHKISTSAFLGLVGIFIMLTCGQSQSVEQLELPILAHDHRTSLDGTKWEEDVGSCPKEVKCGSGFTCVRKCRSECAMTYVPEPVESDEDCLQLGEVGCKDGPKDNCCGGSYCVNYGPKIKPIKKCNKCSLLGESCEDNNCCSPSFCLQSNLTCISPP